MTNVFRAFFGLCLMSAFPIAQVQAIELLMLEQQGCYWCERWDDEIGVVYHKTIEGNKAPLVRIDIHSPISEKYANLRPGSFTPTFVLWDDGHELGRIRGYPGEDFFWPLLNQLLERNPANARK